MAVVTVSDGRAVMANWEAAVAVAVPLVILWGARLVMASRRGVRDRRVGYGIVALLAVLAAPLALPVAAYHWGYLTFLGAALLVLGWRSRQQVTWVCGMLTMVVGVLTGSSVVRGMIGIRESSDAAAVSASVQIGLGVIVLVAGARNLVAQRSQGAGIGSHAA
ncbi:hypothetical protein [Hoyosella subflava]|uniref:hypothetical protein n=1 Tax=Hoyosella subflava TaxID=639313 RepID=UPI0011D2C184|nr:hypothetical protein [Hoyosella subflava]